METRRSASHRTRTTIILAILLIPIVPAVIVQWFVHTSPPGTAISPLGESVDRAIKALPRPTGEAVRPKYALNSGETWDLESRLDAETRQPEGDGLVGIPAGGRFRFRVEDAAPGTWKVRLTSLDSPPAPWVGVGGLLLTWTADGNIRLASNGSNARPVLFAKGGLFFPGPFPAAVRKHQRAALIPPLPTSASAGVAQRMKVSLEEEVFPPLGGVFLENWAPGTTLESRFEVLAYRRRKAAGSTWSGYFEQIWRGRVEARGGRLHQWQGEIRLREVFDLVRDHTTRGGSDLSFRITQHLL